jgi:aspartyl-tRNA(Asn)/glutamyl-tRNA(Gln) amidotransferase subunit C
MSLSREDVAKVAALARLSLTAEEMARYQTQLSAILDAFEKLKALDTEGIEPTLGGAPGAEGPSQSAHNRSDAPQPSLEPELALSNAPSRRGTSFSVPKILE